MSKLALYLRLAARNLFKNRQYFLSVLLNLLRSRRFLIRYCRCFGRILRQHPAAAYKR